MNPARRILAWLGLRCSRCGHGPVFWRTKASHTPRSGLRQLCRPCAAYIERMFNALQDSLALQAVLARPLPPPLSINAATEDAR